MTAEFNESWTVTGRIDSLQSKVRESFKKYKMRIIGEQDGEVYARQGSAMLARLFGSRFALARWLPKLIVVKLKNADQGVTIRAAIGNGGAETKLSPRLHARYGFYFERWVKDLKNRIGDPTT
jgi:hypothetical protein